LRSGGHPENSSLQVVADKQASSEDADAAKSSKSLRSATRGIDLGGFAAHSSASPALRQQVVRGKARVVMQKAHQPEPIRAAAAWLELGQRGDKAQKNGPFKQAENVPRA
jgi:hypothetical protein